LNIPSRPFFSLVFSALALPPKKKMGQKETRQSLLEKINLWAWAHKEKPGGKRNSLSLLLFYLENIFMLCIVT
jgi:hypothetical protein